MINVLVTGVGGTRSIAILKALQLSQGEYTIIGTDANYFNAGSYQCDKAYILPFVSDEAYMPQFEALLEKEKIDIIFATTEKEVAYLAQHKSDLESKYGLSLIVPEADILDICLDKAATEKFLKENNFLHIPTVYTDSQEAIDAFVQDQGLPLIRKPVNGYGSKGLSIIREQADVAALEVDKDYVLQKFIENDSNEQFYNLELNEYTAEIFVNQDGRVAGGIILKRALRNGETVAGYSVKNDQVMDYLKQVAQALKIKGPVNFQFRMQGDKVYIFEINPLFSGTTAIRAHLGFNGVAQAIKSFVQHEHTTIDPGLIKEQYFIRYLEEVFIDPDKLETLRDRKYIERG